MGELGLRVVSAIVLAALALSSAWWGGTLFLLVWAGLAALVLFEWLKITGRRPGWMLGGLAYAGMLLLAMWLLRRDGTYGFAAILFLFAVVWATDVMAYFAGRAIGGPKLAPRISPKKTWSGMLGGVAGGLMAGLALLALFGVTIRAAHFGLAIVLSLASVAGDLFESAFKRHFDVKDSGHLIPGHGGFMDRLDGFLIAAGVAALIGLARGGPSGAATGLLVW